MSAEQEGNCEIGRNVLRRTAQDEIPKNHPH